MLETKKIKKKKTNHFYSSILVRKRDFQKLEEDPEGLGIELADKTLKKVKSKRN